MVILSSTQFWSLQQQCIVISMAILFTLPSSITGCYTSIFSFGDSLTDTGNWNFISQPLVPNCLHPPYGETHFQHPSGRCPDGRLIIDFIAESFGLPHVKPYLGIKNGKVKDWNNIEQGVNFAVAGATALDGDFFEDKGFDVKVASNYSLGVQLDWFKELLPSLCNSSSRCKNRLRSSLFIVGEIGGNDYGYPLSQPKSLKEDELRTYVPQVISAIISAISELIDIGALTLMVPGSLPLGCNAAYLTEYEITAEEEYDKTGCLKWISTFYTYHNELLQTELNRLQVLYPHTNIFYADYYNAALRLYNSPKQFGFTGTPLKVCCGGGGPYNYNASALCSSSGVIACYDPSQYVHWDGLHLTEAAYGWIAKDILDVLYTIPKMSTLCIADDLTSKDFNQYVRI